MAEPVIEELRLGVLEDATPDEIEAHLDHRGLRFVGADLGGRALAGVEFHECEFVGLAAGDADLRGSRFVEVRLERLDAPRPAGRPLHLA